MYKCRRSIKFGSPENPRSRPSTESGHSDITGTKTTKFNRKLYKLLPGHDEKVEMEVRKVMDFTKLKVLHNNLAPQRMGGILLTDKTLSSYEKHYNSLYFFFSHIQNYESHLMLRRE
jgi:hypothetical protein